MIKHLLPAAALAVLLLPACQTVELPKATARGYESARLVRPAPKPTSALPVEPHPADAMIQNALASEFRANGLRIDTPDADLTVAYLVIVQDNVSTKLVDDYFGYGRTPVKLAEIAHERGVLQGKRADYYQAGTIVIDIIDTRTGKLIYRDFATADISDRPADGQLRARINTTVKQALAKFFRG